MLVPAIHFPKTCLQAIEHYKDVFGAQIIHISYYRDAPPGSGMEMSEETHDYVMHAEISIRGTRVNMCDVWEAAPGDMFLFNVFFVSIDEVRCAFHKLREGGKILTELKPEFWTPMYAEVIDRFGIHWQLMADQN